MPEILVDVSNGEKSGKKPEADFVGDKEVFDELSPKSPLGTHGPPLSAFSSDSESLDLILDGVVNTSIEQLYLNVCEMQSSDYSPSRLSYLSYGEESRIDSELRYLAGGDNWAPTEIKKDAVTLENGGDATPEEGVGFKDEDFGNTKGSSKLKMDFVGSVMSRACSGRPPNGKKGVKGLRKLDAVSSKKNEESLPFVGEKWRIGGEDHGERAAYLGPYLLKQARDIIAMGDNTQKALELSFQAMKSFEMSVGSKPSLDFVMCLHVVAALYCRLGRHAEAIPILERSIEIPVLDSGQDHAVAKFSGCMQLGDTYAILGQIENSMLFYTAGLEIQRQVLGEKDPRLGETLRYLAESNVQVMQFDEAEKLCLMALDIHKENGSPASVEEAADRRLLGLICDVKGDYEGALEHYVLASMAVAAHGHDADVAAIDCNIGDSYLSLARYDEAIFAYRKALKMLKSIKGENHSSVASVFVRLASLYNKIGKLNESKSNCKKALQIYAKPKPGSAPEEIASGLVDISAIYESMNEPNRALQLLQKAIKVYGNAPGSQCTVAGIEAQMGVLYYILGSFSESCATLKSAILKFRAVGEKKSAFFGIALNQMGLACVRLYLINEAADLFEEARTILEAESGPDHADTLGVYSNLAGTYDAMGRYKLQVSEFSCLISDWNMKYKLFSNGFGFDSHRFSDAIEILEYVVEMREEKLGTANPDVEDEKRRLAVLLQEAGFVRTRKSRSLEALLVKNSYSIRPYDI
ncbi:tetratricopeptide repeat protein 28-like [Dorcoceras hygrometricum]|uniref:Tetratricopeptide repeat protein 28-like n=1 Tax=Dorcoceras hygrometricum TaxID=472368 RepID=A0A2Z7BLF0_9LAMI|nr:tetratricopeptide repeat protein 28-like [Dorcoceras hygrometricum]